MKPWRYVVENEVYAGHRIAWLECGHRVNYKMSQDIPARTRCHDCFISGRDAWGNALDGSESAADFHRRVYRLTK